MSDEIFLDKSFLRDPIETGGVFVVFFLWANPYGSDCLVLLQRRHKSKASISVTIQSIRAMPLAYTVSPIKAIYPLTFIGF